MKPTTNRLVKSGAISFILSGVLHIAVGLRGAMVYLTRGPLGMISAFGGSAAPAEASALLMRGAHTHLVIIVARLVGALFALRRPHQICGGCL